MIVLAAVRRDLVRLYRFGCGTAVQRLRELRRRYEKTVRNFLAAVGKGMVFIVVCLCAVLSVLSVRVCVGGYVRHLIHFGLRGGISSGQA